MRESFEVSGSVTVQFDKPAVLAWFRAARAQQENDLLRYVRPMMPRRQWQRLRGRMKAARKREFN
jgi:cell division FtsZ-interacting protein ZapD